MKHIPPIGFGTYQLKQTTAYTSTLHALKAGYRHIDTAVLYKNEQYIGQAIIDSKIDRSELFITTKVHINDMNKGHDEIVSAFENSLKDLQTSYVNLLLLHSPSKIIEKNWKTLEYLYDQKKCLMIGISNFDIDSLQIIFDNKETNIYPMVNQIEISPFLKREKLVKYCKEKNIIIVAHSSLTRGNKLNNKLITNLAKKYDISPANLLIKWALDNNYVVLPRSSNPDHIIENISKLDIKLLKDDIYLLNNIKEDYSLFPKYIVI